ncbi:hypothetical protein ACGYLO_17665 [Sulfitobacter sp. 1A13353]|uniref:hypothetical protein n=1 Tax=Sulfitobacter sp. 1A13353 TaxID=3368568 RepID=UPI003746D71D
MADERSAPAMPEVQGTFQIEVKNHAGVHGSIALRTVIDNCDLPGVASWRSITGNDLGNCFFSTMHAAMDLVMCGLIDDTYLVTGLFEHPDVDQPIYHAWLEFRHIKPSVVVNVAMLQERPLYAATQSDYYATNNCRRRIQEIPLKRLKIKARQMAERNQKATGSLDLDRHTLTVKVLKPTLDKLAPLQTAPVDTSKSG